MGRKPRSGGTEQSPGPRLFLHLAGRQRRVHVKGRISPPGQALARTPGDAVCGGWTHGPGGTRCCDVVPGSRASPHLTELLKRIALKGNSWVVKPSSSRDERVPCCGEGPPRRPELRGCRGLLAVALGIQHARAKLGASRRAEPEAATHKGEVAPSALGSGHSPPFVLTQGIWPLPAGGFGLGAMDKACLAHLSPDRSR